MSYFDGDGLPAFLNVFAKSETINLSKGRVLRKTLADMRGCVPERREEKCQRPAKEFRRESAPRARIRVAK
jgi:hypothetical protein